MDLEKIGKRSGRGDHPDASAQLKFLLQSAQAWQQIDRLVKQELPANLLPYIQTAFSPPIQTNRPIKTYIPFPTPHRPPNRPAVHTAAPNLDNGATRGAGS